MTKLTARLPSDPSSPTRSSRQSRFHDHDARTRGGSDRAAPMPTTRPSTNALTGARAIPARTSHHALDTFTRSDHTAARPRSGPAGASTPTGRLGRTETSSHASAPTQGPRTRRGQLSDTGSSVVDDLGAAATVAGFVAGVVGSATAGAVATGAGFGLLVGSLANKTGIPAKVVDFVAKGGAGKLAPGSSPPGDLGGDAGVTAVAGVGGDGMTAGGSGDDAAAPAAGDDDTTAPAAGVDASCALDAGASPEDGDTDVRPRPTTGGSRGARASVHVSRDDATSQPAPNDSAPAPSDTAQSPAEDPARDTRTGKRRTKGRTLGDRRAHHAQPRARA